MFLIKCSMFINTCLHAFTNYIIITKLLNTINDTKLLNYHKPKFTIIHQNPDHLKQLKTS